MTFSYEWKLLDGYPPSGIENHKKTVFGTFICGGGSTMGYKLAGFNHLGGVEIDPKIAAVYKLNHSPQHLFVESIRDFNERENLPDEFYDLDLLDGSPPCSSFSMSGKRDAHWGKSKVFAEGQSHQRLDDLVFVYVDTILKLRPKTFVLENVKGMISGNAKAYTKAVCERLRSGGYVVQVFLINSATVGIPQRRERVFIIGHDSKLSLPKLKLSFNKKPVPFRKVSDKLGENEDLIKRVTPLFGKYWDEAKEGKAVGKFESIKKLKWDGPSPTIVATARHWHPVEKREMSDMEIVKVSSFPMDYNFNGFNVNFLCGMSVPPLMTAHIAYEIFKQWLKKT